VVGTQRTLRLPDVTPPPTLVQHSLKMLLLRCVCGCSDGACLTTVVLLFSFFLFAKQPADASPLSMPCPGSDDVRPTISAGITDSHTLSLYTYLLFWERVSSYRATCTRISLVGAGWVSSRLVDLFFLFFFFFNSVTIDNTAGEMMSFVSLLFPRERDPSHFKCYLYTWDLTAGLGGKNAVVFPR
jgi:hypothetical protein